MPTTTKTATRAQWIAELRSHLGARFQHMGRSNERMDCVGLLVVSGVNLGLIDKHDVASVYPNVPDVTSFHADCSRLMEQVEYRPGDDLCNRLQAGDAITFWIEKPNVPRHVAVYLGKDRNGRQTMIHSYAPAPHRVCEMVIDPHYWQPRIFACWKIRNVI